MSYNVALSWTPSSSTFAGINVYRGSISGGPYTRVDASMVSTTSYTDSSVTSEQTYYYVATEVDTTGAESAYSSEVSAMIPRASFQENRSRWCGFHVRARCTWVKLDQL